MMGMIPPKTPRVKLFCFRDNPTPYDLSQISLNLAPYDIKQLKELPLDWEYRAIDGRFIKRIQ